VYIDLRIIWYLEFSIFHSAHLMLTFDKINSWCLLRSVSVALQVVVDLPNINFRKIRSEEMIGYPRAVFSSITKVTPREKLLVDLSPFAYQLIALKVL
jgi:hypothetical protein